MAWFRSELWVSGSYYVLNVVKGTSHSSPLCMKLPAEFVSGTFLFPTVVTFWGFPPDCVYEFEDFRIDLDRVFMYQAFTVHHLK
jgi:hypothetical protein